MKKSFRVATAIGTFVGVTFLLSFTDTYAQELAFPSAEGFGRFASGGRGGIVCHVDTTADGSSGNKISGSNHYRGTFEYCFDTLTIPRTIVFDVGGTIRWTKSKMGFTAPSTGNVTVACHTAPGADGIQLAGPGNMKLSKANVILRFCRFRSHATGGGTGTFKLGKPATAGISDIIIDHSSILWHGDEPTSTAGTLTSNTATRINCTQGNRHSNCPGNITVQYTIIAEAMGASQGGLQSKLALYYSAGPLSFVRNLFSNASFRMPMWYDGTGEFVNNMFYNGRSQSGPGVFHAYWNNTEVSMIGNGWIAGPHDTSMRGPKWQTIGDGSKTAKIFLKGNRNEARRPNDNYNEVCIWAGASTGPNCSYTPGKLTHVAAPPEEGMIRPTDPIVDTFEAASAEMAAATGIRRVGPYIPKLDFYDQRNVDGVNDFNNGVAIGSRRGTITWLAGEPQPSYQTLKRPGTPSDAEQMIADKPFQAASRPGGYDTDRDGIPDAWEDANGTDRNNQLDGAQVAAGQAYYTNLEMYLNTLAGDIVSGAESNDVPAPPSNVTITP